jgi:hypothetical protein
VRLFGALAAFVMVLFVALPAWAHKPSDAYLTLVVTERTVKGRADLALRDLDYVLGLDADEDGAITWGEVAPRREAIAALLHERLGLASGGAPCPIELRPNEASIAKHSDGAYIVLPLVARCTAEIRTLDVDYRLFFDVDPQHRGIVRIDGGGASRTHVFRASEPSSKIVLGDENRLAQVGVLLRAGVIHIWTGYDHVLFLLALLLPSVLRREGGRWRPVFALGPALLDVARIVTSFTVAHSITLGLSALGIVTLPSRLVESTIAASVVLAALNNVRPVLRHDRWIAAFALGLMHGFGFASTLTDLDLPKTNFLVTLFGFNLGVELGQLAIVAVFVPVAFLARRSIAYRRGALVVGSLAILVVAAIWFVERAFDIKVIS